MEPYHLVLLNTNVTHSHGDSSYNTRRQESENALKIIANKHPQVKYLVDATQEEINRADML